MSPETIPRARVRMICRIPPALLLVASSLLAQQAPPPLYNDLGPHHKAVGTRVPVAQQYFDQGLRLVYGFNHAEAIRSFTRATELDPACAMCWWGIAYAYGPHVNAGMDSASGVKAYEAAQKALSQSRNGKPLGAGIHPRSRGSVRSGPTRQSGQARLRLRPRHGGGRP